VTIFVDSNVLIYCLKSDDPRHPIALRLLQSGPSISVQALNEFCSIASRKLGLGAQDVFSASNTMQALLGPVHPILPADHNRAHELRIQYQLQWRDSLQLAVARRAGARTFFSEDMQDGFVVDGVLTIRNPFAASRS
jgi:predicted nucleic acid-binding protein